jgi:hypothetical protein
MTRKEDKNEILNLIERLKIVANNIEPYEDPNNYDTIRNDEGEYKIVMKNEIIEYENEQKEVQEVPKILPKHGFVIKDEVRCDNKKKKKWLIF